MKYYHLLLTIFIIAFNDILCNLFLNKSQFTHYNNFFIFTLLLITSLIGWLYWRKASNILLLYLWIGLYGFFLLNYLIRWELFTEGILKGHFIIHSYAGFGLSPLTFGIFYLLYKLITPKQEQELKQD